ncbi:MAG: FAD-dependent oxidoreductase [Nitrospirota bacterium]|nr:FAD-dependent oxidoreductase [Nitrospirota bacterium]
MNYLIAGFGPAGAHAATAIREADPQARIRVFSADPHPFYFRASLPWYVLDRISSDDLWAVPKGHWEALRVEHIPRPLISIDPGGQTVTDSEGLEYRWDRLLLACGLSPARLGCPGENAGQVVGFGTLEDAVRVRELCQQGGRAVITGGGVRALSLAWVARRMGVDVTLLVPEAGLGAPWLDAAGSHQLFRRLADDGVEVRLGERVTSVESQGGRVAAVGTDRGKGIACRWVGVGVDGPPQLALAGSAGLAAGPRFGSSGGELQVDGRLQTGAPGIFAAGDGCAVIHDGHRLTCGGWQAAATQGRVAGINMAGGDAVYEACRHYHAATLYDLPMTLIGAWDAEGDAEVTTNPRAEGFRRLVFRDGALIGAVLLGDRRHANVLRRAVEMGVKVRGHELQMLRTDVDLNRLLRPSGEYHLY